MSVARGAAGSSTTRPSSPAFSSAVMAYLEEQVSAEEIFRAAALHVGPGVDHHVPSLVRRRELDVVERRPSVGLALAVRDHLVQGELDAAPLRAAADVDVRDVGGVGRQALIFSSMVVPVAPTKTVIVP